MRESNIIHAHNNNSKALLQWLSKKLTNPLQQHDQSHYTKFYPDLTVENTDLN
jgi:hypothetical protein